MRELKQADAGPTGKFPEYPKKLQAELTKIVQVIQSRYPNTKMVYLSSRTFAGYANTKLNPEPYAYESGFSVKWLIERQIEGDPELNCNPAKGAVNSAWLSWGPYLWWNGETPRADGFRHEPGDFAKDGTHHSDRGVRKLGGELLGFFRSDATTRSWFLKGTE